MKIEFNVPDVKFPKLTRKNLIIAGITLTTLIGGFTAYRRHQWNEYVMACDTAREVRADARRLMVRSTFDTFSYGKEMAVISSDATELYQEANDAVRQCERRGV